MLLLQPGSVQVLSDPRIHPLLGGIRLANTQDEILTDFTSSVHSPQTARRENADASEMR